MEYIKGNIKFVGKITMEGPDSKSKTGGGTGEKRVVCHSVDGIARNVVAGGELKANCDLRFFPLENLKMNLEMPNSSI